MALAPTLIPSDDLLAPPAQRRARSLLGLYPAEIEQIMADLRQPPFRARQLFRWMYARGVLDTAEMTDLPRALREQLGSSCVVTDGQIARHLHSSDGLTSKVLLRFGDGQEIESVEMRSNASFTSRARKTICVSTQAGCAVGCVFCVTGQFGFARNLSAGEIVEQVLRFADPQQPVTNVVYMGMGEPLANYDETVRSLRLLTHPDGLNLGARRITVSTSGIVPRIHQLAKEGLQVGLAISLHAPTDELRSRIMPINQRWAIGEVLAAADAFSRRTGRRVSYEYTLMADLNDSDACARDLARLLHGRLCHVNLIPLNPTEDPGLHAPSRERALRFEQILHEAGTTATIRLNRGQDILAACGQLRLAERRRRPTTASAAAE